MLGLPTCMRNPSPLHEDYIGPGSIETVIERRFHVGHAATYLTLFSNAFVEVSIQGLDNETEITIQGSDTVLLRIYGRIFLYCISFNTVPFFVYFGNGKG